jgi:hypothetical protein
MRKLAVAAAVVIAVASLAAVPGTALATTARPAHAQTSDRATIASRPMETSPAKCELHFARKPHIQTSDKHKGERWADAFEFASCKRKVSTLYLSVSLYKDDFLGFYYEDSVRHTVHDKDYVASSPEVKCTSSKSTTFYAISYAYSIESGKKYSAEGQSPSATLDCGTPGGSF